MLTLLKPTKEVPFGTTIGTWVSEHGSSRNNFSFENENNETALMELNRNVTLLFLPVIVYTSVLMLCGIVGNGLSIYIYGWKWHKNTIRIFLLTLAGVDLSSCVVTMPTEIYMLIHYFNISSSMLCWMSRFTTSVVIVSSALIFVAIAIDRFIRTCYPNKRHLTVFGAKIICGLALCIGVLMSTPTLVLFRSIQIKFPHSTNENITINGNVCDLQLNIRKTLLPLFFILSMWIVFTLCVILLCFFYFNVGWVVLRNWRHSYQNRTQAPRIVVEDEGRRMVNEESNELCLSNENVKLENSDKLLFRARRTSHLRSRKLTFMLVLITTVFIISFLPYLIVLTIRYSIGRRFYPSLNSFNLVLINLMCRSYFLNSCLDPIIYGMYNYRFRNKVKGICVSSKRMLSLSRQESIPIDGV